MKPFLLLAGEFTYPNTETGDWIGCFETREEAEQYSTTFWHQWHCVVDLREWMEDGNVKSVTNSRITA